MEDGQEIPLGDKKIKVLHTPGHTVESVCYLIDDKAILTGDTLFLGDVGRPDLAQTVNTAMTKEKMAAMMFSSIQRLKTLQPSTIVLSGHGSGSACGKNIQGGTHCTIAGQMKSNYTMAHDMTQDKLVGLLCTNSAAPQNWFGRTVALNLDGYTPQAEIMARCQQNLDINEAVKLIKADKNMRLVDCRPKATMLKEGFIPESYGVYFDGAVAQFVGQLFNSDNQFIIICQEEHKDELMARFSRIGYDNIFAVVHNVKEYQDKFTPLQEIPALEMSEMMQKDKQLVILDCRKQAEWDNGHLEQSVIYPMDKIG